MGILLYFLFRLGVDESVFGHEMFGCRFLSDLGWERWY